MLVTTDGPTLTHHSHPKSIAEGSLLVLDIQMYIRMYDDMDLCHSFTQRLFTALRMLCIPPTHPSSPQPPVTAGLGTVFIVLPFPECHLSLPLFIHCILHLTQASSWRQNLGHYGTSEMEKFLDRRTFFFACETAKPC